MLASLPAFSHPFPRAVPPGPCSWGSPGNVPARLGTRDPTSPCQLRASPCPCLLAPGLALEFRFQLFSPGFSCAQWQQDLGDVPQLLALGMSIPPPSSALLLVPARQSDAPQGAGTRCSASGAQNPCPPRCPCCCSSRACWRSMVENGDLLDTSVPHLSSLCKSRLRRGCSPCPLHCDKASSRGLKPSSDTQDLPARSVDTMISVFVMLNTTT